MDRELERLHLKFFSVRVNVSKSIIHFISWDIYSSSCSSQSISSRYDSASIDLQFAVCIYLVMRKFALVFGFDI